MSLAKILFDACHLSHLAVATQWWLLQPDLIDPLTVSVCLDCYLFGDNGVLSPPKLSGVVLNFL